MSLFLSRKQLEGLSGTDDDAVERWCRQALPNLRVDFSRELAELPQDALRERVAAAARRCMSLQFADGSHLYRLVAWSIFLGDDFMERLHGGEPARIARTEAPESERFERIRVLLTARA
jgi:hypothetical protein